MKDENDDRLETFVKVNRQEFDKETPNGHVWKGIDEKILDIKKPLYKQEVWFWRAASVILLIVSLFLYRNNETAAVNQQIANNNNHEFDQVEGYYVSKISEKRNQIEAFQKEDVDQSYEVDLQRLDAMYEVLKEELDKNPSKEVKDALTLNLLIRIDLLNNQLQTIEDLDEGQTEVEQAV